MKTIAEGFSFFRAFLNEPQNVTTVKAPKISLLDAILAIFLDEESSRHRSQANTLFANEVSKLILNEENVCELSFWDYEFQENGRMEETKKWISKDGLFLRMIGKVKRLIEEDFLCEIDMD